MLLDGRIGERFVFPVPELLDVSGDHDRPDGLQAEAFRPAPPEEPVHGLGVGGAGVAVADVGGEEFEVALGGVLALVSYEDRDGDTGPILRRKNQAVHGHPRRASMIGIL